MGLFTSARSVRAACKRRLASMKAPEAHERIPQVGQGVRFLEWLTNGSQDGEALRRIVPSRMKIPLGFGNGPKVPKDHAFTAAVSNLAVRWSACSP